MDGYEVLIGTDMWIKLRLAQEAAGVAQQAFEESGFAADEVFAARSKLTNAENQLRWHFKHKANQLGDAWGGVE